MGDLWFEPFQFVSNLMYMLSGMVGIFIVIGLIIFSVFLLNYFTSPKKKDNDESNE